MKRWLKIGLLIAITLAVIPISFFAWGISSQKWGQYEDTIEIWLPEHYVFTNKLNGSYVVAPNFEPSGSTQGISLADYKKLINEGCVTVIANGTVCYWIERSTEYGETTYVTYYKLKLGELQAYPIEILDDKTIKLWTNANQFETASVGFFFSIGAICLGIVSGWAIDRRRDR